MAINSTINFFYCYPKHLVSTCIFRAMNKKFGHQFSLLMWQLGVGNQTFLGSPNVFENYLKSFGHLIDIGL
jgi:hypothetical protein